MKLSTDRVFLEKRRIRIMVPFQIVTLMKDIRISIVKGISQFV